MKWSVLHATVLSTSLVLGVSFLEVRALASDLEPQPFDARLEVGRRPWDSFPNTGKSLYFFKLRL